MENINNKTECLDLAPITLFCYNRPDYTRSTLEALKNNDLALHSDLIVYADAPRNTEDIDKCKLVLSVVETYKTQNCFHKVKLIVREKNYGLADNIVRGVTEVLDEYGKIIVLEDDIVTHYQFLKYMNSALNFYNNTPEVMEICGYIEPIKYDGDEGFAFLKHGGCWGWATWKRSWQYYEKNPQKLLSILTPSKRYRFNMDGSYNFFDQIRANACGEMNTWAIFWNASIFLRDGLVLYPSNTLAENIGNIGEHSNDNSLDEYENLSLLDERFFGELDFPNNLKENKRVRDALKKYFSKRLSLKAKIYLKLDRWVDLQKVRVKSVRRD